VREPIGYAVSPAVDSADLNALFEASWERYEPRDFSAILGRSVAWVCAYHGGRLVGFVHAAWDGGVHAFLLDTTVAPAERRTGVGLELVRLLVDACRERGVTWLHVDYEPHLGSFYERAGFARTAAGLIHLGG